MDPSLDESWLAGDFYPSCTATALELDSKVHPSDIWDRLLLDQHSSDSGHFAGHLGLDDGGFRDAMLHIGTEAKAQVPAQTRNSISSSSSSGTEEILVKVIEHDCTACTDSYPASDLVYTFCEHHYCAKCIASLFETAAKDESRFPPKCCGKPISLDIAKGSLTPAQISRFMEKSIEYSTTNRTYCSREGCYAFIEPAFIEGDTATCGKCFQETCTDCKCKSHEGECPEDVGLESLVKKAAEKGWQRCFKCKRMVERVSGCNHMRCRCNTEFCYTCGQKWKTCDCKYNEVRRNTHVRPRPLRVRCDLCDSRFAIQPDLRRHMDIRHSQTNKVWICIDKSADRKLLSDCRDCQRGRKYAAYYTASAHLRRAHFGPRSRGSIGGRRGGPGGGQPPMRDWIMQVDDAIVEYRKPTPEPDAELSRADGPATQPFPDNSDIAIPLPSTTIKLEPQTGPQAEHGIESPAIDIKPTNRTQNLRPACIHTYTPSITRQTYLCTLCSGTICECDKCGLWFCYLCGFSADIDLNFGTGPGITSTLNSSYGLSTQSLSYPLSGHGFGLIYDSPGDFLEATAMGGGGESMFQGFGGAPYGVTPGDLPNHFGGNGEFQQYTSVGNLESWAASPAPLEAGFLQSIKQEGSEVS